MSRLRQQSSYSWDGLLPPIDQPRPILCWFSDRNRNRNQLEICRLLNVFNSKNCRIGIPSFNFYYFYVLNLQVSSIFRPNMASPIPHDKFPLWKSPSSDYQHRFKSLLSLSLKISISSHFRKVWILSAGRDGFPMLSVNRLLVTFKSCHTFLDSDARLFGFPDSWKCPEI